MSKFKLTWVLAIKCFSKGIFMSSGFSCISKANTCIIKALLWLSFHNFWNLILLTNVSQSFEGPTDNVWCSSLFELSLICWIEVYLLIDDSHILVLIKQSLFRRSLNIFSLCNLLSDLFAATDIWPGHWRTF